MRIFFGAEVDYENHQEQFEQTLAHAGEDGFLFSAACFYGGACLCRRQSLEAVRGQSGTV